MYRSGVRGWLAGVALGCAVLLPTACGPTVEAPDEGLEGGPSLASQVQGSFGGDLGRQMGLPAVKASTVGKSNDVTPSCSTPNFAPDLSYTWTPPITGRYRITTKGSLIDTVLMVYPLNNSSNVLGCNDQEPDGGQDWSSLLLNLSETQTYVIVVDGWSPDSRRPSSGGPIQLNITSPDIPCLSCISPPNTCYQSTGTCQEGVCVYPYKSFGASCSSGDVCTVNEICDGAGTCGAGSPRTCNTPPGACYAPTGTCSSTGGCSYPPRPAGTSCDDSNADTLGDACNGAGACVGKLPKTVVAPLSFNNHLGPYLMVCVYGSPQQYVTAWTNTSVGPWFDAGQRLHHCRLFLGFDRPNPPDMKRVVRATVNMRSNMLSGDPAAYSPLLLERVNVGTTTEPQEYHVTGSYPLTVPSSIYPGGVSMDVTPAVTYAYASGEPLQFRLRMQNESSTYSGGTAEYVFYGDGSEWAGDLFSLQLVYEPL